jgi:Peptidase family M41
MNARFHSGRDSTPASLARAKQLRATAYHEAGHALADWRLNAAPIRRVSIVPGEDTLGHVLNRKLALTDAHIYDLSPRVRDRLERLIVSALAGGEAEKLVTGRRNHRGAASDYGSATNLALRICGGDAKEAGFYLRWLWVKAVNLVRADHNRPALDAVAFALLERHILSGDEVYKLLQHASR